MAKTKATKKNLLIILMLIGLASVLSPIVVAAPKWPIPDGVKTNKVNDYDMAYQEAGSGVPIVIVHGAWVDYRFFSPQVSDFSKTYRTIAVSLRHHYPEKWDGVGDDFSIAQHASDVAALIKNLNLGKVHLIGHSRGGAVALTVAKLYPEVIRTLILEDASGLESLLPQTSEGEKIWARLNAICDSVQEDLKTGNIEKTSQKFWNSIGGPGAWEKVSVEGKQRIRDNIVTATQKFERPEFSCSDIQKFNFPILPITGERSSKRYGMMIDAMRQCKPDIPGTVIVPNATHQIHYDNPEFFKKAVLEFVNQH